MCTPAPETKPAEAARAPEGLAGVVEPTTRPSLALESTVAPEERTLTVYERLLKKRIAPGWAVLGLCCLIATISSLDRVMMSVAILPMSAELVYSDTTKGLIAAAFTTGYFLCFVPAGVLAATSSPTLTLTVGLLIWSAAQAATPAAAYAGLSTLLGCRALMGLGEAATFPSIQAIAARWVPAEYRSRFWGLLQACFNVGTVAAYAASPALIDAYGWPDAFILYGAAGVVLAVLWAAVGRDEPPTPEDCPGGECPLPEAEVEEVAAAAMAATTTEVAEPPSAAAATQEAAAAVAAAAGEASADAADGPWARALALPWGTIASSRPVWALTAGAVASNSFLLFAIAWLPSHFSRAERRPALPDDSAPCASLDHRKARGSPTHPRPPSWWLAVASGARLRLLPR